MVRLFKSFGHAFNRTIVELKSVMRWDVATWNTPFNRTIVELKFNHCLACDKGITCLLIVP